MNLPQRPMPSQNPFPRRRESASSLVLVVFVVAMLGILIGLAFDYTSGTGLATKRGQNLTAAQALANGALEAAYKTWSTYMSARQSYSVGTYARMSDFNLTIDSTDNPTGNYALSLMNQLNANVSSSGYKVEKLTIRPVTRADIPKDALGSTDGFVGPLANTPGWVAQNYNFRARVTVTKTSDPTITVTVSRYFQQSDASLFQAMLFFQNDLELHPGPDMTLYGLVHTNANMYIASGSGGSLKFTSNVSYAGNASTLKYNVANADFVKSDPTGYVEGTTARLYDQEPGNWSKGTYHDPVYYDSAAQAAVTRESRLSGVDALNPLGINVTQAQAANPGNPNATDLHEIVERPVPIGVNKGYYDPNPNTAYTDPDSFSAHRLYNTAGLRVLINHTAAFTTSADSGATKVTAKVHVFAPATVGSATSTEILPTDRTKYPLAADNITDSIIKAIAVGGTTGNGVFKDMREGRDITTNTVDVSVLTPALNTYATGHADYNGVFYIADITNADTYGNSGNSDAIRLKKGGTLPTIGLTVVTDGALYVQGDYNTGTTYAADLTNNGVSVATQPLSNTDTSSTAPTHYTVGTYVQKPAAVVGDAVMILSNAWTDLNDSLALGDALRPKATATTFNAALVSGAVITTDSAASGGAHNFPRFLEDWQSKTPFTYHGSMCELYESDHFKGVYGQANVYSPPSRRWYFDDNFLTTPPPGNLRTTSYSRGRWMRNQMLN